MHEIIVKVTTTDGVLFLLACLNYACSRRHTLVEAVYGCASVGTLLAGVPLVLACIWTG